MTGLGWAEEKVAHKENTPLGEREFTNLIYTFDPDAPRRLILSAHFDSKWFDGQGVSPPPCSLHFLEGADPSSSVRQTRPRRADTSSTLLRL